MANLEQLLDAVRASTRSADFAALAELAPRLEAALADKSQFQQPGLLLRLKAKADENAAHLDAARRGLRSARRRLDEVQRAAKGLQTYDGKGRRADIAPLGQTAGRF